MRSLGVKHVNGLAAVLMLLVHGFWQHPPKRVGAVLLKFIQDNQSDWIGKGQNVAMNLTAICKRHGWVTKGQMVKPSWSDRGFSLHHKLCTNVVIGFPRLQRAINKQVNQRRHIFLRKLKLT